MLTSPLYSQLININKSYDHVYLKRVFRFYGIDFSVQKENISATDSGKVEIIDANSPAIGSNNYDRRLKPLVKYSKDNRRYIDYASYSTIIYLENSHQNCSFDIDMEVSIGNVDSESKSRIAFVGSSEMIEGAGWVSENLILIVKRNSDSKLIKLELVNLNTMTYIEYGVKQKINFNRSYFYEELSSICKIGK